MSLQEVREAQVVDENKASQNGIVSAVKQKPALGRVSLDRKSHSLPYTLVLSFPVPALDFEHEYFLSTRVLGQGVFGVVQECVHRESGRHFAVKQIPRKLLVQQANAICVQNEVKLLQTVRGNDGSVWLQDIFEDNSGVHLVMELLDGPDVVTWMDQYQPQEQQVRYSFMRMVKVIQELHSMNIMHADVKPQNFVFGRRQPRPDEIKIVDFGAAVVLASAQDTTKCMTGTRWYWAPDVFEGKCGLKSDIWALGVSLCFMLTQELPFGDPEQGFGAEWITNMLSGNIVARKWGLLSLQSKHLIKQMLDPNPQKRPDCAQILQHSWFFRTVSV